MSEEVLRKRASDFLIYPAILGEETPLVKRSLSWFNEKNILGTTSGGNHYIKAIKNVSSFSRYVKGTTSEKENIQLELKIGYKGGFSTEVGNFSSLLKASFDSKFKGNSKSEKEYEYFTIVIRKNALKCNLQYKLIEAHLSEVINDTFNQILNVPGSEEYNKYSNDDEGMFKLIEDCGLCCPCTATLGAYAIYTFERLSNVSNSSIELDAKVHLEENLKAEGQIVKNDVLKISGSKENELDFYSGFQYDKYQKITESKGSISMEGGNSLEAKGVDDWEATDNPNNWNLISFSDTDEPKDGKMILIYSMIADKNSERAKAMYHCLYDENGVLFGNNCPYMKYLGYNEAKKIRKQIVADIYAQWMDRKDIKPFIKESYDGKERLYIPFLFNQIFPGNHDGYPVAITNDISPGIFQNKNMKKAYAIFYSMDNDAKSKGILDIMVSDPGIILENETRIKYFYKQRGDSWFDGGDDCKIKENGTNICNKAIYIRLIDVDDYNSKPITAVGLVAATQFFTSKDNQKFFQEEMIGMPFASTRGTELMNSNEGNTTPIWKSHWGKDSPYYCSYIPLRGDKKVGQIMEDDLIDKSPTHIVNLKSNSNAPERMEHLSEYGKGCLFPPGNNSSFFLSNRFKESSKDSYGFSYINAENEEIWTQRTPVFTAFRGTERESSKDYDNNYLNCGFGIVYRASPLEANVSPIRNQKNYL